MSSAGGALFSEADQQGGAMTLHQYAEMISRHVNSATHLANRWVIVEVARIGMSGPHCYAELIQKDNRGATIARMKGTIWANSWRQISSKFYAATGKHISSGMKVMFRMSASHAAAFGLSANITDVDPAYTLGDAERRRREILECLYREGILDLNKRLPLIPNAQKIAVISASTAAGYGDFMNQLENSGFVFYSLLYPAAMQGVKTVPSVLEALDKVEMAVDFWDAVVIIRGGGATDDLNSFDDAALARRVATYPLPVIVGIGHERDRTVLDEIAHTRCKTPTAVASFLIDRLTSCERHAEQIVSNILDYSRQAFMGERRRLAQTAAMIPLLAPRRLDAEKYRIDLLRGKIQELTSGVTRRASEQLTLLASRIESTAHGALSRPKERLEAIPRRLEQALATRLQLEKERLQARKELIDVLSPTATLRRGYSITRINGKAVRKVGEVPSGSIITTTLPDGQIMSTVK